MTQTHVDRERVLWIGDLRTRGKASGLDIRTLGQGLCTGGSLIDLSVTGP